MNDIVEHHFHTVVWMIKTLTANQNPSNLKASHLNFIFLIFIIAGRSCRCSYSCRYSTVITGSWTGLRGICLFCLFSYCSPSCLPSFFFSLWLSHRDGAKSRLEKWGGGGGGGGIISPSGLESSSLCTIETVLPQASASARVHPCLCPCVMEGMSTHVCVRVLWRVSKG